MVSPNHAVFSLATRAVRSSSTSAGSEHGGLAERVALVHSPAQERSVGASAGPIVAPSNAAPVPVSHP
jgi:hypothetical protein